MTDHRMRDWLDAHSGRTYRNFIDGEWTGCANGSTYSLYEAALPGHKLGEFPESDKADADRAVEAADRAFRKWKRSSASFRAAILFRFADLLERDREELAYIVSAEQGKVLAESLGEIGRAAAETRFAAGEAYRAEGQTLPSENDSVRCEIVRYPIGVVAAISPWNFPVVTPVRKIAPALAYGCTVVLKPASATPWSSVRIMELLAEAGAPRGVVNLVHGSGSKVGDPLVHNPLVKGISFTGSTALGMRINGIAASRLARTQLELGGKNAAIVLDCERLEEAAEHIVNAAFACSGQRCTAISRVIVLKDRAEALIGHIKEKISRIRVGPAWDERANMGPLIDRRQFETAMRYIEIGVGEGAKLECGGETLLPESSGDARGQGYYLTPALFTRAHKDMRIANEEIFGPVLVVLEANDVEEAVDIANSTVYGLAAAVFAERIDTMRELSERLDCGMVHINHGTASQAHVPFGGVKQSGYGAFSIGHSNQEFYTGLKAVYAKSRP